MIKILYALLISLVSSYLVGQNQIEIDSVIGTGRNAISIAFASGDAIQVKRAGDDGIYVEDVMGDGVVVDNAGSDGLRVNSAVDHSLHIRGSKSATDLQGHIALIYNVTQSGSPDVLALKVGSTASPHSGNNFITFYHGNQSTDTPIGQVEGNGSGGVTYSTSGADYAEYLPVLDQGITYEEGDVVGIHDGRISHQTLGAAKVMVISGQAAVLGNFPKDRYEEDVIKDYRPVSFIGQISVKIRGVVNAGDWIVASGQEDGTAIAIPSSQITLQHQIIGQAWASSSDPRIKRVNTAIGLDHSYAKDVIIDQMQQEINELRKQLEEIKRIVRS